MIETVEKKLTEALKGSIEARVSVSVSVSIMVRVYSTTGRLFHVIQSFDPLYIFKITISAASNVRTGTQHYFNLYMTTARLFKALSDGTRLMIMN